MESIFKESDRVEPVAPEFTLLDPHRTLFLTHIGPFWKKYFSPLFKFGWTFWVNLFTVKFWVSGLHDSWADSITLLLVRSGLRRTKELSPLRAKKCTLSLIRVRRGNWNFLLNNSGLIQHSATDFFRPVAGLYELQSPKKSSLEYRLLPVDSS